MIIYKITNLVSGKCYVGQTIRSIEERFEEHRRKKNTYIGKAIRFYGQENFRIEAIDSANNQKTLNDLEMQWIDKLKTMKPNGYNLCLGGGNTSGYKHRTEAKLLMSKNRGRYYKEDNPFYGKKHDAETRARMSAAGRGKVLTPEWKKKIQDSLPKVKVINLDTGEIFVSAAEAARIYDGKSTHITRVCRGKRKRTRGCRWAYYDDYINDQGALS